MAAEFAAVALHRPSRPENIGGVLRAADVYGVELVVLGGGELPPEPPGHPTDTTRAWLRIPVVFADEVLDALPEECMSVAVERVVEATPLPVFEHPERAMYLFGPENGSLDERMLERCAHVVSIPGRECRIWPRRSTWCATTASRSGGLLAAAQKRGYLANSGVVGFQRFPALVAIQNGGSVSDHRSGCRSSVPLWYR